ncbi:MAG TPA: N-acetyltransferase [Planctomycetota bacterium]|nr:N-acetyltransferase [Planctomycetota bacterium]
MSATAPAPRTGVELRPLRHPARFLDLQRQFYRGDPYFVPPMTSAQAWLLDRRKNPFFRHAEAEFFAAWCDGRVVGRVSAVRDRLHDEFHGDQVGFFGHFEAVDAATTKVLVDGAADWCRAHGATSLRGPVDLSTNYQCGLLVDGKPGTPVMNMPYNPPSYGPWLEAAGLHKAKDLLALFVAHAGLDVARIGRLVDRLRKKSGCTLRRLDLARFDAEVALLWQLYNRIWERNWGFVPMTEAEFLAQARDLKKVAHPALMHIAEIAGEPVGFIVALPDVNVAVKACNGRLLPFGWLRFLRAMKQVKTVRTITLGVVPEHRKVGIEMQLMHAVTFQGIEAGFRACEASWILEDNHDMLGPLQTIGHVPYRRYRIYEKALA